MGQISHKHIVQQSPQTAALKMIILLAYLNLILANDFVSISAVMLQDS